MTFKVLFIIPFKQQHLFIYVCYNVNGSTVTIGQFNASLLNKYIIS